MIKLFGLLYSEGVYMKLLESGEMYLESILTLSRSLTRVRSVDICRHMNFSKPSVSRAVGLLKSGGYINVDENGNITLTECGLEVAEKTYSRHELLTEVFIKLGVSPETAEADACKIEHDLSDETIQCLMRHLEQYGIKTDEQ